MSKVLILSLLLFFFIITILVVVDAAIHSYKDEKLPTDLLIYRHAGIYSLLDSPYVKKGGRAYIKVHLQFRRTNPEYHGESTMIQVSVFEASNFKHVGYAPPGSTDPKERLFCCSPELKKQGVCEEEYTLILKQDVDANTYVENVEFLPIGEYEEDESYAEQDAPPASKSEEEEEDEDDEDNQKKTTKKNSGRRILARSTTATTNDDDDNDAEKEDINDDELEEESEKTVAKDGAVTGVAVVERIFQIDRKGMYYLMFSSCNELTGDVLISGKTEWVSPYGYLPGELYGFLPFYAKLSFFYLVLGLLWGFFCAFNWRTLLMLQNFITAVLALGMVEVCLRYFDFATYNKYGTRSIGLMVTAAIFQTIKKCVSRLLILIVALGYGIVKPSLGSNGFRVVLLGGAYFILASVQHIVESLSHTVTITFSQYLLMLPVAALDLVFYFWIFRALRTTIEQLETRKQDVKLSLYIHFQRVLIASVAFSVGWSMYYMFVILSQNTLDQWESRWMYDGFWDVLYLLILVPIMILFRPSASSLQYEYSRVGVNDDEDTENDDLEEYGSKLQESIPSNSTNQKKDALTEVEDAINSMVDSKPVTVKKD